MEHHPKGERRIFESGKQTTVVYAANTHLSVADQVIWLQNAVSSLTPDDPCAAAPTMPLDKAEDPSSPESEDHGGQLTMGPSGLLQQDVILLGGVDEEISPFSNDTLNVTAFPNEDLSSSARYQ